MKKESNYTHRDLEAAVSLCSNRYMVTGTYTSEQIKVLRLLLQIDGIADPYLIIIAPSTEPRVYEVWLNRQGYGDVTMLFGLCARTPDELVDIAVENAMRYIAKSFYDCDES